MKKIIYFFILLLVIANSIVSIELNSKIKSELNGYMEFGYYRPENMDKSFKIDEAGITLTASAESIKGIIEINYKDSSDSYFNDERIFFKKIAAMYLQQNGGIIVGKYENKSMLRSAEFQTRNTLNYSIMDKMINKHTPLGAQYFVETKNIDFSIGIFNGLSLTVSDVYNGVFPSGNILCFNDETKNSNGNKTDLSGFVNFKTDAGISVKSGYLTGKLSSNDLAYLNSASYLPGDTSFSSDDKKILYFAIEQKNKTLNFSAAYYLIDISSLKNKTLEITGKINMSQGVSAGASYTQLKYSNSPKSSALFGKRRQIIFNTSYSYKYFTTGYEYVINSEKYDVNMPINTKNNAHVIKAAFVF